MCKYYIHQWTNLFAIYLRSLSFESNIGDHFSVLDHRVIMAFHQDNLVSWRRVTIYTQLFISSCPRVTVWFQTGAFLLWWKRGKTRTLQHTRIPATTVEWDLKFGSCWHLVTNYVIIAVSGYEKNFLRFLCTNIYWCIISVARLLYIIVSWIC